MGKRGIKFHYLWKAFIIIPIVLLYNISILLTEGGIDSSVGDMLANSLFETAPIVDMKDLVFVIERMYYIFIFNMIYGTYVYHDFQVSSIYLFSRLRNRKKWFFKNVIELVGFSLTYSFLFLATLLAVCMFGSNYPVDGDSIKMLGILLVFITLFLTVTTLVVNLLAIRFDSITGFICVYMALLILTALALKSKQLLLFADKPYLSLLNPVAAIIFNFTGDNALKWVTTIYYIMLNGTLIFFGVGFTNSLEVGLLEKEKDG